jgi:hypothetical protein
MGQFVKGIITLDANMNGSYVFCIFLFNQGIDFFYKLQNGLFGDLKMLTHLLLSYCVIKKFEI